MNLRACASQMSVSEGNAVISVLGPRWKQDIVFGASARVKRPPIARGGIVRSRMEIRTSIARLILEVRPRGFLRMGSASRREDSTSILGKREQTASHPALATPDRRTADLGPALRGRRSPTRSLASPGPHSN